MHQTIQFSAHEDDPADVMDVVARAFGHDGWKAYVRHHAKNNRPAWLTEPLDEDEVDGDGDGVEGDEEEAEFDAGPWNVEFGMSYTDLLTADCKKAIALVICGEGVVGLRDMRAFLRTDSLRGVFSTMGAAARNTPDLDPTARPFFKVTKPVYGYTMNADVRIVFREVFEELGLGHLLASANAFFQAIDSERGRAGK